MLHSVLLAAPVTTPGCPVVRGVVYAAAASCTLPPDFSLIISTLSFCVPSPTCVLCRDVFPAQSLIRFSSALMAFYAFVIRRGIDLVSVTDLSRPSLCSSSLEAPVSYGYRVVVGYFKGQFTLEEINGFMAAVALSQGSAPAAEDHFHSLSYESRVITSGLSFRHDVEIPLRIQAIMEEYNKVKFIDVYNFERIRAEWACSLSPFQVVRLSEEVF